MNVQFNGELNMRELEAKLLCNDNDIRELMIQHSAADNGWILNLVSNDGVKHTLISKRAKTPRIFKTLDACVNRCQRISLANIQITVIPW